MSSEIAPVTDPSQIATLPPEQRGELITHALVESKQWLAVATKGTDPTPVAEFKAWAATVAEMTRQKGLAKDIQMDAQEMVRRAERGIGQTVRNGQATGEIVGSHDNRGQGSNQYGAKHPDGKLSSKRSPTTFLKPGNEMSETYDLTDGVTDEDFEEALEEARGEGNVSRANVIRNVQDGNRDEQRAKRRQRIIELAAANYTSRQIAETVGMRTDSLGKLAREMDLEIPADQVVGRTRHLDPDRIISETVNGLHGFCIGIALLEPHHFDSLDPASAREWSASIGESVKALNKLRKELNRDRGR